MIAFLAGELPNMKIPHRLRKLLRPATLALALVAVLDLTQGCGSSTADASCADYCTAIMANCSADRAQYADTTQCMNSCAGFTAGVSGTTSGNSVACRTYHAGAAQSDPVTHCVHAGPGGAGVCGTDCEGFCTIAQKVCTDQNAQFASVQACTSMCASFKVGNAYSIKETSGDSIACRLYHVTVASKDAANATTHCPHIVAASPVCK